MKAESQKEPEVMIVYGRDQLAAAVTAIPDDAPVTIKVMRADDSLLMTLRFDYSKARSQFGISGLKRAHLYESLAKALDARRSKIAGNIRKLPVALFA